MPTLVVQMVHSGRTSGATGAPGERDFTEAAGAACQRLLSGRNGWSVRLIAADVAATSYRGDGFAAIHADGSVNPSVRGASYGHQSTEGRVAAEAWRAAWQGSYHGPWNPPNYTTNLAQYYGVRNAVSVGNRRAFILEAGTITNAEDRALLTSPAGLEALARSVGSAFGIPLPEEETLTCAINTAPGGDRSLWQAANARATALMGMVDSDGSLGDPAGATNELAAFLREMRGAIADLAADVAALRAAVGGGLPELVPEGSVTFRPKG